MNIVYFGTDVFLSCFKYLLERHHILALYTYHNDEDYFTEYSIVRRAGELGIPVHYEVISPETMAELSREPISALFFTAEYSHILSIPSELGHFRGINVHSSLLPQGRSYYPLECAMERNLPSTGVTLHKLTANVDSGDILAQRTIDIKPETDSVDLYLKCGAAAREMLEDIMEDLDAAWQRAVPQRAHLPYWNRPALELLTLEHRLTLAEARDMFRRYNSMTQVKLDGSWYYVTALLAGTAALPAPECRLAKDRWLYRTVDGHLRLTVHPISKEAVL